VPGGAVGPAALAAGAVASLLYVGSPLVRSFVTLMAPIVIVSPLLFLGSDSVGSFLSSSEPAPEDRAVVESTLPSVVMIIFDELPLTSLLDEEREIDRERYPNFAALAATSSWYRNTTALHYSTWIAIPSILTGSDFYAYTRRLELGDLSGKLDRRRLPKSLFSLLEGTHRILAMESFTDLAPLDSEVPDYRPSLAQRFPGLLLDTSILYAHIAVPAPLAGSLPALYGGWQELASDGDEAEQPGSEWPYLGKKAEEVKKFIELLRPPTQPTFYFVHFSLPHFPFTYNEAGQSHEDVLRIPDARFRKATGEAAWASEPLADLAYQAHLLQLGFTDRLLGHILERLKTLGLFDDSLILITSDHGTSFYWNDEELSAEELARVQASDTLHVPLIVKAPGQTQGATVDHPVQLLDVVPTIADLLGVEIPWVVDGIRARDATLSERPVAAYLTHQTRKSAIEPLAQAADRSLRRKLEVFGAHDLEGLYAYGAYAELIGKPVESFASSTAIATVTLTNPGRYRGIDPGAARLPAYIAGELLGFSSQAQAQAKAQAKVDDREFVVAVAINGVISGTAVTTAVPIGSLVRDPAAVGEESSVRHFVSRVPPSAFASGNNIVTVHGIAAHEPGKTISLIDFVAAGAEAGAR
jgi:hypothetical protein